MATPEPIRILHLEDSDLDSKLLARQLTQDGLNFVLKRVETLDEYVSNLQEFEPQVVLSDNSLPGIDCRRALSLLRADRAETPFILVSGTVGEERATELLRSGATDYVLKERLVCVSSAIERALVRARERVAQRQTLQALRARVQQFRDLTDAIPPIVWTARANGEIDYVNQRWFDFSGAPDGQLGLSAWVSILHVDDRADAMARLHAAMESGEIYEIECRLTDPEASDLAGICAELYRRATPPGGSFAGAAVPTDIDDRKRAEQQLLQNAYCDALTKLPNRALFENRLEQAMRATSRAPGSLVAVLFLDVDRFKIVNASLGHAAGDRLLSEFARRVEPWVGPGATLARFGGDEFAILLPELSSGDQATRVAERILQALAAEPFAVDGHEITASASIGVASSAGAETPQALLRNADSAAHRAKALGRGRCELFDEGKRASALERLQLEADLRHALERRELLIHYQPIVSLATGHMTGCEALVRWKHAERGLLQPEQFIPLAEETGLIVPIGAWVLETACSQMRRWLTQGMQAMNLAINFSARQLSQRTLAAQVARVLTETGLDPRRLQLDLSEGLLAESFDGAIGTLCEISALGVQLAIDDFGTGYRSLAYLKQLPCSALKIHRSFIRRLEADEGDAAIVTAVIALAHSLGLSVVAEGIETDAQRNFLVEQRCDEGQGHWFSPALSAEAFLLA